MARALLSAVCCMMFGFRDDRGNKKAPDRCVDRGALFLVEPVFLVRNGLLLVAVE
jgi:hypothetical protein